MEVEYTGGVIDGGFGLGQKEEWERSRRNLLITPLISVSFKLRFEKIVIDCCFKFFSSED